MNLSQRSPSNKTNLRSKATTSVDLIARVGRLYAPSSCGNSSGICLAVQSVRFIFGTLLVVHLLSFLVYCKVMAVLKQRLMLDRQKFLSSSARWMRCSPLSQPYDYTAAMTKPRCMPPVRELLECIALSKADQVSTMSGRNHNLSMYRHCTRS